MNIFDNLKDSLNDFFNNDENKYMKSNRWKEYMLGVTATHCYDCYGRRNKVYEIGTEPTLPEHERCKCYLEPLRSISIGTATKKGINGADFYLKYYGKLPEYYITKEQAKSLGWKSIKGNLGSIAPGKMIGGNIYYNKPSYLPESEGRIWYECDIDYNGGFRNTDRLIFSNDGLIFKTDCHYQRFIAVE